MMCISLQYLWYVTTGTFLWPKTAGKNFSG